MGRIRRIAGADALVGHVLADTSKQLRGALREYTKGDVIPEGSRNQDMLSIAGSLRADGLGFHDVLTVLDAVNVERCEPPLPIGEVHAIAKYIAKKPPGGSTVRRHQSHQAKANLARITDLRIRAAEWVWSCGNATSCKAVLDAMHRIGHKCASLEFSASERQIAEEAGLAHSTVGDTFEHLEAAGWFEKTKSPERLRHVHRSTEERLRQISDPANTKARGTGWRLLEPRSQVRKNQPLVAGSIRERVLMAGICAPEPTRDIWRNGCGLGRSTEAVYLALSSSPISGRALAKALYGKDSCESTARNALNRLATHNLARREKSGWVRGSADLDEVEQSLPSAKDRGGALARQKERHRVDREGFAEKRARFAREKINGGRIRLGFKSTDGLPLNRPSRPPIHSTPRHRERPPGPEHRSPEHQRETDHRNRLAVLRQQTMQLIAEGRG